MKQCLYFLVDDGNDTTSYNVIPTTQLVGLDVSLTNPNYMSTAPQPSSLMQERETKRLSLLSEFHHTHCLSADRHDGGTPQSIALRNVRASYAAIPLPVTDEVVEEDVYSLVADEHNYSCISSTEEDILGHLSSDSGREEGSEHNYSCINSRSCSHLSSVSSDMKNKEPFDYEEFYSIANVDKETISESDGENDHKNTDREEIAEDDNAFYISTDVDHRRKSLHVPLPSYPVPIATCTRKRSVTSNDIFGLVGATSDDINITMWPEVITKPTPKPRKPRNWNSVSLLND